MEESIGEFFNLKTNSPYMLLVAPVNKEKQYPLPEGYDNYEMYQRLYHLRSEIPAVTHVDYSARIQSVNKNTNNKYWTLINSFKNKSGCPLIVNTSFNVRGEPIVCTPEDAYKCFMRTEMDWLVMGNLVFDKKCQPEWNEKKDWRLEYELD